MSLSTFFNANSAILFLSVAPFNTDKYVKLIAYLDNYNNDLGKNLTSDAFPFREEFARNDGQPSTFKFFKGHPGDRKCFGKNPAPQSQPSANPFVKGGSGFPDGLRLTWGIVPHADITKIGDVVGTAALWADNADPLVGDAKKFTSYAKGWISLPIYQVGEAADFTFFKGSTGPTGSNRDPQFKCRIDYIATLGSAPKLTVGTG